MYLMMLGFFCLPFLQTCASSCSPELLNTAKEAYIFAYPLVLVEVTKNSMLSAYAPLNQFAHLSAFPDERFTAIVRPNVDTLYSNAWLDLEKEPIVLSVPDMRGRYYLLEMLDAWTNVFASVGKRTTGTKQQQFLLVGPSWKGKVPDSLQKIQAPTNTVWILGRTQTNGKKDYDYVHSLQKGYMLTPLSEWGKKPRVHLTRAPLSNVRLKKAPVDIVAAMNAKTFFETFARALKTNVPSYADEAMMHTLKNLGIEPGNDFDFARVSPEEQACLEDAVHTAQKDIEAASQNLGKIKNGWRLLYDTGTYGTDYLTRAAVAYIGIGANLPDDAVYPTTFVDNEGNPLDGHNAYVLHFQTSEIPPVSAFWSVTLYDDRSFLVGNELKRYGLGDRDPLQFNKDGSLDIFIQHENPGQSKESNWLPAPLGTFNVSMRLYWPKKSVLDGTWSPPAIRLLK